MHAVHMRYAMTPGIEDPTNVGTATRADSRSNTQDLSSNDDPARCICRQPSAFAGGKLVVAVFGLIVFTNSNR